MSLLCSLRKTGSPSFSEPLELNKGEGKGDGEAIRNGELKEIWLPLCLGDISGGGVRNRPEEDGSSTGVDGSSTGVEEGVMLKELLGEGEGKVLTLLVAPCVGGQAGAEVIDFSVLPLYH